MTGTKGPPAAKKPAAEERPPKDDTDDSVESEVGEEDPGSAVDVGETESLSREDIRNSES